ncbi:hypothetical protein [Halomicrobium urmianum]|uniref:hypothetical protein n=1 Tax=Halomicrobium urmianum TaxID=1586233 RepID=UPI001CDA0538|nr:hypothetical protein [Halomicrobium urmianum]
MAIGTLALAVAVDASGVLSVTPWWLDAALAAAAYGLLLGGAHLYLALRGENDAVPVASRWRFLTYLAAILVLGTTAGLADRLTAVTGTLRSVMFWAMGAVTVAYFVTEGVAAYRDTRP